MAVSLALWGLVVEIMASWLIFACEFSRQESFRRCCVEECARMMEELRGRDFEALEDGTHRWSPSDPRLVSTYGLLTISKVSSQEKLVRVSLHLNDTEVYSLVSWIVAETVR